MKYQWIESSFAYDGSQLKSLYAYLNHKVQGDSIVSWIGPCQVDFDHMVDGEDLLARSEIRGSRMLHFIVEKFETSLFTGVVLQRLLSAKALEILKMAAPQKAEGLLREGDDLWLDDRKLSISIATVSPVSCLIHFALNIENEGTPVKTLSLKDLEVEPKTFAQKLGESFAQEVEAMRQATCKVKWVK